jgi:DNA-binding transcriptional ArsR family regulator
VTGTTQETSESRASGRSPAGPRRPRTAQPAVDAGRAFAALADPRRRELLELLARTLGCSASSLAASLPVSRQAVAQHLAVLEDSSLVRRRRAGREVLFSVRPEQLAATATWLTDRAVAWGGAGTAAMPT